MRLTPYPWAILTVLLVAAPSVAEPPASTSNPKSSFEQHKADGDRARLEKRWQDAIDAYGKASAIREDALVMGRAGLILAHLERFDLAAPLLEKASTETAAQIAPKEQQLFYDEFRRSKDQVCRVDVHIDQTNARIEIDGKERGGGRADFYVYVNPGVHTIFAQKPGFHDAVQTLMTDRACKRKVALIMQPVRIEQLSLDRYLKVVPQNPSREEKVRESSETKQALYDAKPPPNPHEPSLKRWFVGGAGVWIPFFATPGMSVGLVAQAGARLRSNFEIGLEARAAVHLVPINAPPNFSAGSAYAWSFGLPLCGRFLGRVFLCGVPQVGGGERLSSGLPPWLTLGLGGRLGLEFHPTNRIYLRFYSDFTAVLVPPSYASGVGSFTWKGKSVIPGLGMSIAFF